MKIYKLSREDVLTLAEMLTRADLEDKDVRVSQQGNGVMFKVGQGAWTWKMGEEE